MKNNKNAKVDVSAMDLIIKYQEMINILLLKIDQLMQKEKDLIT